MTSPAELLQAAIYAYKSEGNKQRAISLARKVVESFPGSGEATKAGVLISRLEGQVPSAADSSSKMTATPVERRFQYKFVQIPSSINVSAGAAKGQEAADFIQSTVDEFVADGWEFYRIDSYGTNVKPGCLGMLFGMKENYLHYYVISFRKLTR